MNMRLAYLGHSRLTTTASSELLTLAPNLAREPVAFDAPLLKPLRFREAISSLHDVVVSDLRFKKRDKSAYEEYKKIEQHRLANIRREAIKEAREKVLARADVPPDLDRQFNKQVKKYWTLRLEYSAILQRSDPALWRMLTPCDPVITVADDVCFFECFSADESAYGCLTVNREDGFGRSEDLQLGTTNVDYSWDLYHHFQALRSYKETRFKVDPAGFTVATQGNSDYREEKIDLPQGWLRGFMQIQSAMGLPMTAVPISREAVYSLLAYLKRHRLEKSPRALRFELVPDKPPVLVLEPWEIRITSHGTIYTGPPTEPIRIWGRRRLAVLARTLPMASHFTVHLLGTGLPSFWLAHMGEMTLTVGLSGWTTNDWTRGSALDLLMPETKASPTVVDGLAKILQQRRAMDLAQLQTSTGLSKSELLAGLNHLAYAGQLIHDLSANVYRWRQIMPQALGEAEIGPENPELAASRRIISSNRVEIERQETLPGNTKFISGKAESTPVEIILDAEERIKRGKCLCGHFKTFGLRNGPCRHMLALRSAAGGAGSSPIMSWDERMRRIFGDN
ncbi:MAG TPA: hypothetical protein VFW23_19180 [Tepidisphaeraceae bacterium]|nr:hypothetical protein [Tepidisphaeraceae bacterium]